MKQEKPRQSRTALFFTAAALLATPVVAQEAQTATPPATEQVTPPPAVPTAKPDGTPPASTQDGASTTPVDPAAQAQADAEEAERRNVERQAARARHSRSQSRTAPRARPTARVATPAPAEATVPAPAAQPSTAAPSPAPVAASSAQPEAAPTPADQATPPSERATQASQTTTAPSGAPAWPLIAIGVLILAGIIGLVAMRRRRAVVHGQWNEPAYVEPAYAEPVAPAPIVLAEARPIAPVAPAAVEPAVIAPVDSMVAPAVPEDATVAEPEAADVEALTAATPVADRPWLEFSMRPVRAGASESEAIVEIELTVGNAGAIDAEDVRVSTFMFPAGSTSDMERLLVQHQGDAAVAPMRIAAGEGTRIDATLALPRADLIGDGQATGFQPVVVADARYRLPDGSEGRTSASFVVGIASEGELGVIDLASSQIREDVEARLYREPVRV